MTIDQLPTEEILANDAEELDATITTLKVSLRGLQKELIELRDALFTQGGRPQHQQFARLLDITSQIEKVKEAVENAQEKRDNLLDRIAVLGFEKNGKFPTNYKDTACE